MANSAAMRGTREGGGGGSKHQKAGKMKNLVAKPIRYTLQQKLKVIQLSEEGVKNCDIRRALGIPDSSVRGILRRKEHIRWSLALMRSHAANTTSQMKNIMNLKATDRQHLIAITEYRLLNWGYRIMKNRGTLTNACLQKQACIIFQDLCREDGLFSEKQQQPTFNAPKNWLLQLRKRCIKGEYGAAHRNGNAPTADEPNASDSKCNTATTAAAAAGDGDGGGGSVSGTADVAAVMVKEEPLDSDSVGLDPGTDPLALQPEEERQFRSQSPSKLNPRVVLPRVPLPSLNHSLQSQEAAANTTTTTPRTTNTTPRTTTPCTTTTNTSTTKRATTTPRTTTNTTPRSTTTTTSTTKRISTTTSTTPRSTTTTPTTASNTPRLKVKTTTTTTASTPRLSTTTSSSKATTSASAAKKSVSRQSSGSAASDPGQQSDTLQLTGNIINITAEVDPSALCLDSSPSPPPLSPQASPAPKKRKRDLRSPQPPAAAAALSSNQLSLSLLPSIPSPSPASLPSPPQQQLEENEEVEEAIHHHRPRSATLKRKRYNNFQQRFFSIKLKNEMIRQQILREMLTQSKIDTAVKGHKALQCGVDLSHI